MTSNQQNRASLIRDDMRKRILMCEIAPSSKLNISELAAFYDVSLGAVREALSSLEGEGLVTLKDKRGYHTAGMSLNELVELTQARIEIESSCIRLAILEGDIDWESRIVAALHKLLAISRIIHGELDHMNEEWSSVHDEFHSALVAGCKNAWLLRMRRILFEQSERYRRLSVPIDREHRDVDGEHRGIADAVLRRNADEAVMLLGDHFKKTLSIIGLSSRNFAARTPATEDVVG